MGHKGNVSRSSSRGRRRGKRSAKKAKEDEDRLSELSDDLINHILCNVDSKVAVRTMVLSKRWVNVWTTLSCLNFEPPISHNHENFVRKFLENRDQQCLISKLTIDCHHGGRKILKIILDHALAHNIEHLSICNGDFNDYPCLNSACMKTLQLMDCELHPMNDLNLPSLTSLYLKNVRIGKKIENLKELSLKGFGMSSKERIFRINCPKLQSLTLYPEYPYTFIVSAPNLSHLSYCSRHVPAGFSAKDGFPFIKQVHIDIQNGFFQTCDRTSFFYFLQMNRIRLAMKNFTSMLNAVKETVLLELSSGTIEGLRRIQNLEEFEPPSLCNLESITLPAGLGLSDMWVHESTDDAIKYLFADSPCAKIIVKRW